ncbi:calcium-binding tyrosine phosphorylation-regulated protein [Heterocephalus glaber]|uniref:Calcium-binding tyrosine phosphorylation-regulated protein n=1 Tax=Heterocephalus glaber TaxID=10181 RepID=A0AAX6TI68_HETGA|nr:calcium-binding tyrosine phosphorylation-regulated protein [Heterocephalus glaber]XP_021120805.1 calcium-binding tyrosine phosphorylation-regulated protein [Heterocephalus glaber]XP_021120806.1 calcium-binding tyrosine phosphorylation-regulated protein [Heterocephalus glaber]
MISSKSRLVIPNGLKTLLEGVSRAILKTNPSNITQFAAVYFKELAVFREGNASLDIKDLVKQFHQIKVQKWSEGMILEKKLVRIKESEGTSKVFQESTQMEKCTDTEEDNIAGPQFINKSTQFPLDRAEHRQPEEKAEAAHGPSSKPATPKATSPAPSPSPAPVSAEFAYVPADLAQLAAQMLAIATSEARQPPPYSNNTWTLYCLTDKNQQSCPSPPPAPGPFAQATLYLSNSKDPQFLQNSPKITSPYVMTDDSKTSRPPFVLVGSNVQEAQDWKSLPGHTVVSQSDGVKRYAIVHVPIAVAADQKFQKHTRSPQNASPPTSGHDGPRPQSPVFLSVAFPVEDVAKKGSESGDKHTPFGSYGIAGEITVTSAHVRRAEP